jgi:hypothetical protein
VKAVDQAAYFEHIGYKPHPKQQLFHSSRARFRVPVCGRRFGKSVMGARDEEPRLLIPGRRVWAVGPTYDLAEKEFRVIWDDMIIKLKFARDKRIKKAYNKRSGDMYIEFPWRTRIECRSADHPENLVGEKLDHVIMSEAAKHKKDTWERYIRPALADKHGTASFPTTPEGFNWLHALWQQGQRDDPDFDSWQFPSWENPYVYPDGRTDNEILLVERTTAKEWFEQEYGASFTAFVGKIFGDFQETVHVKPHKFNPDWQNFIAFDWGFTNPLAAIEFQVSPMDEVFVWREHYKAYMTLEEHLYMLKSRENPEGYHLDLGFGDAADPEATLFVSQHYVPCVSMPEAKANWRDGIDLVNSFLRIREPSGWMDLSEMTTEEDSRLADALRRPGLTIDPSCENTIREFNGYRVPATRLLVNPREAAQKYDDHALDALRYGMMHYFKFGCNSSLADVYTERMPQGQALGHGENLSGYEQTYIDQSDAFGHFVFTPETDSGSFFDMADMNF